MGVTATPARVSVVSGIIRILRKTDPEREPGVAARIVLIPHATPPCHPGQNTVSILLDILFFLAATIFSIISLRALLSLPWAQRLPATTTTQTFPKVSVIFAARD